MLQRTVSEKQHKQNDRIYQQGDQIHQQVVVESKLDSSRSINKMPKCGGRIYHGETGSINRRLDQRGEPFNNYRISQRASVKGDFYRHSRGTTCFKLILEVLKEQMPYVSCHTQKIILVRSGLLINRSIKLSTACIYVNISCAIVQPCRSESRGTQRNCTSNQKRQTFLHDPRQSTLAGHMKNNGLMHRYVRVLDMLQCMSACNDSARRTAPSCRNASVQ